MKNEILLISTLMLAVMMLSAITPVLAIGPWGALENGNNPT